MSFALEHMGQNIWCGKFTNFGEDIATHGFSCRLGGVSKKPWQALNMGLHVGDTEADVLENRRRFLSALHLKAECVISPEQVHGTNIMRVTEADAGRGALAYAKAVPKTDALITNVPGLPIMLCFADCVPILFFDAENKAVGIAHGGWKGTVNRIAAKTVQRMQKEFGTDPGKLRIGIGPSIGACCYAVREDVSQAFREAFPGYEEEIFSMHGSEEHLDLWAANRIQLMETGVPRANIEEAKTCTSCEHAWFYSYRADGSKTGRMATVIALHPYIS